MSKARVQTTQIPPQRDAGKLSATAALGLLLLAMVPYLNTLGNSFVYDDNQQILENPYVHSFHYLKNMFSSTVWTWEGAQGVTNYYRPLMTLAYLICYKLFGSVPFGFHLLNLVLHAGVVLLLFALTRRLFGDRLPALIAAGLFALHPIHTESVAWIAGVTDLELSVFFLLTFLLYLRLGDAEIAEGPQALLYAGGMMACYSLALLSKEQAMMLAPLAIVYEHLYRADRKTTSAGVKISRYLPLCVVVASYLIFRSFVLGSFAPAANRAELSWWTVALTGIALAGQYIWKLIWPMRLVAFYVFHESRSLTDPRVLGGIAALAGCLMLFAWLWRRAHAVSFALVWMGATIAPVLNVRWLPAQAFAERYLYLPSAGFCWILGWAAAVAWRMGHVDAGGERSGEGSVAPRGLPRTLGMAVPVALALLAVFYGIRTIRRNRDWQNDVTLYTKTLAQEPDAQIIRTDLGVMYWNRGDAAAAEREWTRALGPHAPYAPTLNDMGLVREQQKRYDEAIEFFDQALARRPLFTDPHKNLGDTYAAMGRFEDADRQYRLAVGMAPLNTMVSNAYGHFLLDRGRVAEAKEQFARSAQADLNPEAEQELGSILLGGGDTMGARAAFETALKLNPYENRAHFGLATIAEREGQIQEALRQYREGLQTDPMNAEALAAVRRLAEQRTP